MDGPARESGIAAGHQVGLAEVCDGGNLETERGAEPCPPGPAAGHHVGVAEVDGRGSWGQGGDWSHILQGGLGKLDIQDQLQAIR
jgi:hypothetical protein